MCVKSLNFQNINKNYQENGQQVINANKCLLKNSKLNMLVLITQSILNIVQYSKKNAFSSYIFSPNYKKYKNYYKICLMTVSLLSKRYIVENYSLKKKINEKNMTCCLLL